MIRQSRIAKIFGIIIGLSAAMAVLAMSGGHRSAAAETGPMMSECDGAIRSVVVQYVAGADFAVPIYRQLLAAFPAEIRVYVACPDAAAFDELSAKLGPLASRLTPIFTGHAMTAWSRDRWVALQPAHPNWPVTLLSAPREAGAEIWPARAGDERIGDDLATHFSPAVASLHSNLNFDGGDLLADDQTVFVAPGAILRNVQKTVADQQELIANLQRQLKKQVVLLNNAPDHHVGMFMMAAGNRTVVVGDPSLAKPFLPSSESCALPPAVFNLPGGIDLSAELQSKFDSVAAAAEQNGYRVVRIPIVCSPDQRTYLTFLNGLIDDRAASRTIYLPQYSGADDLNAAGRSVWQSLGYRVVPIDVTSAYRFFGTLHCVVNVLEKS